MQRDGFFETSHLPVGKSEVAARHQALIVYRLDAGNVLAWANQAQRLALYGAGAGVMALAAGFTGTAIAQYGSSSGPIVKALRGHHGKAIRRNWLNIVRWLFWCALLCLVALAVDGSSSTKNSEWIFEVAVAVSIVKVIRLVFLFDLILSATDGDHDVECQGRLKTDPLSTVEN
jgi:hypothetical protein